MFCSSCGNQLNNNFNKCNNCGQFIEKKIIKRPKALIRSIIYGLFSLACAFLSLYSLMLDLYCIHNKEDTFTILSIIFSILIFSITGIMLGIIGFIKAKIVRKGGLYVTCEYTFNISGIIINFIELILASLTLLFIK